MIIQTYITLADFLQHGGKLNPDQELFNVEGKYIGEFVRFDDQTQTYLLRNATYRTFPMDQAVAYVKVKAKVLINS